ncbi:MAG: sugar hydrolase, partial [Clostridia bacterium]|nr:sugar hydrolase [Clostridia bacterium]
MNKYYLEKADLNLPKLYEKEISSDTAVDILPDESAFLGAVAVNARKNAEVFVAGDRFTLDFGDHRVGYLSFRLRHEARYLDAPVRLHLRFGETPYELSRDFSSYYGRLCPSWLQEDIINVDSPGIVSLPRRYWFRYLEVTVISTPRPVRLTDFSLRCVTSADETRLEPLPEGTDPALIAIDRIAAKTLADCMQTSYEDGPKRDRRLWSGDLRLQALTDYYLFKNDRLARRCLYLFAACEDEGRYLPGCLYEKPSVFFDDGMGI